LCGRERKNVKRIKRTTLLPFLWLVGAGNVTQGQPVIIGYTNCVAVTNFSQLLMNHIGQVKWYFPHASVGECMMDGVTNLHLSNPGFYQLQGFSSSNRPPGSTQPGRIYEDDRGNPGYYGNYQIKLDLFNAAVSNGWHYPLVNIALPKFCFIDIWTTTNTSLVNTLINSYLKTMTNQEASYPDTLFPYATMPLTTTNYRYAGSDFGPFDIYWRNVFNDSLRGWCLTNNRVLLDIADIEAHDTNGNLTTFVYSNRICQQLYSGYNVGGTNWGAESGDYAHPTNPEGEKLLARAFYALAATVVNRWTNVNRAPTASDDSYGLNQNTTFVVNPPGVLANDMDPDGDPISAWVVSQPVHGALTLNTNGGFVYVPATNYFGADSFTYQCGDGLTNSAVATVSLTITNMIPPAVVNDDSYRFLVNTRLTIPAPGVLANDIDNSGSPLSAVVISGPAHGTLQLSASGRFSYTPFINFVGTDSFTYLADNGFARSLSATVTLSNSVPVSLDAPIIGTVILSNGTAVITWRASAGLIYRLQTKTNVADGVWQDVQPDVLATTSTASATDSAASTPSRIYRVLLVQ
jgi:hypothetical protein